MTKRKLKIAIFHAFLKGEAKGGAELLMFQIRDFLKADFWVGAFDFSGWGKDKIQSDPFVAKLWQTKNPIKYLHKESKIPIIRHLKRYFYFLFSPKVKELAKYDVVIFQGNNFFVQSRLRKISPQIKQIMYVNTPPRIFTDQFSTKLNSLPFFLKPFFKLLRVLVIKQYKKDATQVDYLIANSENIKNRLLKYLNLKADKVIFPILETADFRFQSSQDYFLSYARLEEAKRIPLILEAFSQMPDQKLVICSSGPLADWVKTQIQTRKLTNIDFRGRVSDAELTHLVGNCRAGVFIPKDEDAGMTQIELMSAGKPVIGVAEGGLLETIIDKQTGVLLPKNIQLEDLKRVVREMTELKSLKMKDDCQKQAKKFSKKKFLQAITEVIKKQIS